MCINVTLTNYESLQPQINTDIISYDAGRENNVELQPEVRRICSPELIRVLLKDTSAERRTLGSDAI